MNWREISNTFAGATGLGRTFQLVLLVMFLLNVGLSMKLMGPEQAPRTIITPPNITQTFWVDDAEVSPEYLVQMGQFLLALWINVSPQSVEFQSEQFMRYVNPSFRGAMKERIQRYVEALRKNQASMVFYPNQAIPDAKNFRIVFKGTQKTFVGKEPVQEETVNYLMQFRYNAGQISLVGFCQTPAEDSFAEKAPEKCKQ